MLLQSLTPYALEIPFTVTFKHAAAERHATQALLVRAQSGSGNVGYGEGCPREYVTSESLETVVAFVMRHRAGWQESITDLASLRDWITAHRDDIDGNAAAWSAVEVALIDLLAKEQGDSAESMLGLPEIAGAFCYSAVIGDAAPSQFDAQVAKYCRAGFRDFKIKLSGDPERDLAKVQSLTAAGIEPGQVRADANNLWRSSETAIVELQALGYPFSAIEEPLKSGDFSGMRRIALALNTRIILDESVLRLSHLKALLLEPALWIVNVRVSKMGGVIRSLELVERLRSEGLSMIVGAHVGETSILTRAALTVAHSGRDILIAQEGAFGTHLLLRDVVEPPLMFGVAGRLELPRLAVPISNGFGLTISEPIAHATPLEKRAH